MRGEGPFSLMIRVIEQAACREEFKALMAWALKLSFSSQMMPR